ncbi:MAG: hypothetical protein ACT4QD_18935 [Acidobacteriota bacterium]
MKAIVILVLVGLVVLAAVRAGDSIWRNMKVEDAVEREARLGDHKTTSQLRKAVIARAADEGVDLEPQDIAIELRGRDVEISFQYSEPLALVPAVYTREQIFDVNLRLQPIRQLISDEQR